MDYISKKLTRARYKILEDGAYFGEVPGLQGVWASAKTLEGCRETLREVLEEWLILKLRDGDPIPDFPIRFNHKLNKVPVSKYA